MLLGLFWAGQFAAGWTGYRRARRAAPADRLLAAVVPWAAVTTLSLLLVIALEAPYSPWDLVRLAPTVGWVRSLPLYSGRNSGPILSTMYAPLAALAYVPAALARDAALAAVAARGLACIYYFLPIYLVCVRLDESGASQSGVGTGVFLLAALASLASAALRYSATQIHADAPALGMLGMACWLVMRQGGKNEHAPVLACLFAWLSVWSKQTMVLLPLVLGAWWVAMLGLRAGLRTNACLLATGLVVSAAFLLVWGGDSMYFNAVLWPGSLPWKGTTPGNLAGVFAELLPHVALFGIPLLAGLGRAADSKEGANRWILPAIVGLALVPMAVLGRVKKGGDINSFSPVLYPLMLACAARGVQLALRVRGSEESRSTVAWKRLLTAGLVVFTAMAIPRFVTQAKLHAKLRPAGAEHAYLRAHPGEVYFPWNPLAHLTAEGRLTHHAHSVWERGVAGYPVCRSLALAGIPARCRYVCFPLKRFGPVVGFSWSFELMDWLGLVGPDATPVRLAGLPDYECYPVRR